MIDLHFVCQQRKNWRNVRGNEFESGNWAVAQKTAREAIGGRIYLHEHRKDVAWHGGTITDWRKLPASRRLIFSYVMDGPYTVKCESGWGQEKAIVRR